MRMRWNIAPGNGGDLDLLYGLNGHRAKRAKCGVRVATRYLVCVCIYIYVKEEGKERQAAERVRAQGENSTHAAIKAN